MRSGVARCLVCCAAGLALGQSAALGQVVFSDNFDADTSANWNNLSTADTSVTFAFDYSTMGIPPSPRSGGTTLGLRVAANILSPGGAESVTLTPVGQNFLASTPYQVRFEMWINANGPFPAGGAGSTEFGTIGIGHDNSGPNIAGSGSGGWFAFSGEGGSSRDYRAYKNGGEQFAESTQWRAGTSSAGGGAHNASDPYYAEFGDVDVPTAVPFQAATYPQQTGATQPGAGGFEWHDVRVTVNGATALWTIDGLEIAELSPVIGSPFSLDGNIAIGYMDVFSSLSDNPDLSFAIIDNVEVCVGECADFDLVGGCCFLDGTCMNLARSACVSGGGEFGGYGSTCAGLTCEDQRGACCFHDGTCSELMTEGDCFQMGGDFGGAGSTCGGIVCVDIRPPNDECANAEPVSVPGTAFGNTTGATTDAVSPCGADVDPSFRGGVWYSVMGNGGVLVASTCENAGTPGAADFDTQIQVFSGTCGSLVCEDGNDDEPGCNAHSTAAWSSTNGVEYLILVNGWGGAQGTFTLSVFEDVNGACCFIDGTCQDSTSLDCPSLGGTFQGVGTTCGGAFCPDLRPPNDNCVNAIVIPSGGGTASVSTEFAQADDGASNCGPSNADVWFSFTPAVSGPYSIDTIGSIDVSDTLMDIYEGGCGGPLLFCDDDGSGIPFHAEAKDIFLDAGVEYLIRVAEFGVVPDPGEVVLFVSGAPLVNGACCVGTACSRMTEADCATAGGTYLGDFSECDTNLDVYDDGDGLRDDGAALRDLPFTFNYWGVDKTDVVIAANGLLTFDDDPSDSTSNGIPNAGVNPFTVIAPLWFDLDPSVQGSVHAAALGSGANERYIVQWDNVPEFGNVNSFTFQAVLFSDGAIEFRYGDIVPEATPGEYGIGLSNEDGTMGVAVAGNTINDGDCLRFDPDPVLGYVGSPCANALEDITGINPCDVPPPACLCELTGDDPASVDVFDLLAYLSLWFANAAGADIDGDPGVDVFDLLFYLQCWFPASAGAPCP